MRGRSVVPKNWFTIFSVKVTARACIIKIWLFLLYLNCWSVCNQTCFDSTTSLAGVSYAKIGLLQSRSQQMFKMSMNVCLDGIFWTAEHFVTKLGMVMQYHELESHVEKLFVIFKVKGSHDQSMTPCAISSELLILWKPDLVWWYIIISQSDLWKKWITAFRVKVTAKG